MASAGDMNTLRETWKTLYARTLPSLAKARDRAQPKWPVTLDHCFARIILDNTIGHEAGENQQHVSWDKVIGKPAVQNMSEKQLMAAIELGEKIKSGKANLVELDKESLKARGKWETKYDKSRKSDPTIGVKRKQNSWEDDGPRRVKTKQSTLSVRRENSDTEPKQLPSPKSETEDRLVEDMSDLERDLNVSSHPPLHKTYLRIQKHQSLTPFRRRLYTMLLSVPRGRHTTYAAMSNYLSSAARAVGSGMRNNPFAPDVPCHQVLAADGTIGGFGGDWDRLLKGKNAKDSESEKVRKKVSMLEFEGVRFDSRGKVKGPVFEDFHEDEEWFKRQAD